MLSIEDRIVKLEKLLNNLDALIWRINSIEWLNDDEENHFTLDEIRRLNQDENLVEIDDSTFSKAQPKIYALVLTWWIDQDQHPMNFSDFKELNSELSGTSTLSVANYWLARNKVEIESIVSFVNFITNEKGALLDDLNESFGNWLNNNEQQKLSLIANIGQIDQEYRYYLAKAFVATNETNSGTLTNLLALMPQCHEQSLMQSWVESPKTFLLHDDFVNWNKRTPEHLRKENIIRWLARNNEDVGLDQFNSLTAKFSLQKRTEAATHWLSVNDLPEKEFITFHNYLDGANQVALDKVTYHYLVTKIDVLEPQKLFFVIKNLETDEIKGKKISQWLFSEDNILSLDQLQQLIDICLPEDDPQQAIESWLDKNDLELESITSIPNSNFRQLLLEKYLENNQNQIELDAFLEKSQNPEDLALWARINDFDINQFNQIITLIEDGDEQNLILSKILTDAGSDVSFEQLIKILKASDPTNLTIENIEFWLDIHDDINLVQIGELFSIDDSDVRISLIKKTLEKWVINKEDSLENLVNIIQSTILEIDPEGYESICDILGMAQINLGQISELCQKIFPDSEAKQALLFAQYLQKNQGSIDFENSFGPIKEFLHILKSSSNEITVLESITQIFSDITERNILEIYANKPSKYQHLESILGNRTLGGSLTQEGLEEIAKIFEAHINDIQQFKVVDLLSYIDTANHNPFDRSIFL
ncbi:MAG: hypothetical protein ACJAW3_001472, partial [Lentimonas sp.]